MAIASAPPAEDSPAGDGLRPSAVQAPTPGDPGKANSNQPTQRQRSCSGVGQVPEHPRPAMPPTTAGVSRGRTYADLDRRHFEIHGCAHGRPDSGQPHNQSGSSSTISYNHTQPRVSVYALTGSSRRRLGTGSSPTSGGGRGRSTTGIAAGRGGGSLGTRFGSHS